MQNSQRPKVAPQGQPTESAFHFEGSVALISQCLGHPALNNELPPAPQGGRTYLFFHLLPPLKIFLGTLFLIV